MPLITQQDIEAFLQVSFDAIPDQTIERYIDQAQSIADQYCQQPLEYTGDTTEVFEGIRDTPWHSLERSNVVEVSSVVEDGVALSYPNDYRWYEDGSLRRTAGQFDFEWSRLVDAVTVVYKAGYSLSVGPPVLTPPDDLVRGIAGIAAGFFQVGAEYAAQGAVPIKSVALDGSDTITYAVEARSAADPILSVGPVQKQDLAAYVRRLF